MISKKRLTNAAKWNNPAFRKLSPRIKLFWFYLLDTCDHAGFWQVDFEAAHFFIGEEYSSEEVLNAIGREIIVKDDSLWFIPAFIHLQYRCLSEKNPAHKGAISRLREEGYDPLNLPKASEPTKLVEFWDEV